MYTYYDNLRWKEILTLYDYFGIILLAGCLFRLTPLNHLERYSLYSGSHEYTQKGAMNMFYMYKHKVRFSLMKWS